MVTGIDRDELREVSAAVLAVATHLEVRDVLQTILTSARRLVGARYAALGVPDKNGGFAEFLADGISDEQWAEIGPVPRQHGLLGVLLSDPHPVRLDDIRAHPEFGWWPAAHPVLTDFLGVPITDGDEILGEIFVANKEVPGGFTAQDEELLALLASHAAIALVNARLYERSRELSIVEERNRIARELHDSVTQKLFSLRLTAEAAAALLDRDLDRARAEMDTVRKLAAAATDELSAVVIGLRSPDLAGDGLDIALRKQADLLNRVHDAAVRFSSRDVPRLTSAREEAVYRIAQEALHNALRHAQADEIEIDVSFRAQLLVVRVKDDGIGFDTSPSGQTSRRLGLSSMRERARAAGGRLKVTSERPGGTTVLLEVPVD
ncbi:Histidine kinase-, DNA gyrase B-, and HSP90-like ATPase [Actinokineospora alba]|uniref:Histidine kinase-, DNA gyrase B-, and HSP90-like ATPase n=1 Tax=Actinokineospora alba TaxID=504798 RepID=A0A1H0HUZ2_9PSEU|nr:histidine kinase/DNA gyrase B/HSP90-like ATPase [Actinokineospora alba]SDH44476.1 Histidine kinase-, DNA gyrase B-, and HSP90-like ATPase [Actinokineospora alba]SDO22914.1 Histidine kinase-, DNA gyrase B-, and HSP90-like ATPase [Actinokineospora alba]